MIEILGREMEKKATGEERQNGVFLKHAQATPLEFRNREIDANLY